MANTYRLDQIKSRGLCNDNVTIWNKVTKLNNFEMYLVTRLIRP